MGHKLFFLICIGVLALEARGAGPQQRPDRQDGAAFARGGDPRATSAQRLTIRVYDYTGIRPTALARTRIEASRVLATAGIEVRWEQCRTSDGETNQDESCAQRAGVHVIQLRVHSREMSKKLTSRSIEFGYSVPLEKGFGIVAGVYLDRTSEMAQSLGLDLHVVLGHTMAHEIGHLLLGTNSHAPEGVMRPKWGDRDVRLASTGSLRFTEAQSRRMQEQVGRRLALAEALER